MSLRSVRRQLLAVTALAMTAGVAQGATVYQLQSITFQTSSAPGIYNFGSGPLAASVCMGCGSATITDDGLGNLTVSSTSYWLAGFGADIVHTFAGTTTLGAATTLIKAPGETCADGGLPANSPHLCSLTDQRGWVGDRYNGFLGDGTTVATARQFSALVSGSNLVMRIRTNRDATPDTDTDWLQMNFNYSVVPVPGAVWLFGSALGLLGVARRRSIAARA